jgi:Domain of unknown function (DUF4252)
MNPLRASVFALLVLGASASLALCAEPPVTTSGGYVDGAMFRALVDDTKDVVEVNLDGAILQALAKSGNGDHDAGHTKDLFAKLKSIHAVIGTVKGPAASALALVQQTDQTLSAAGWQRITRITDATSTVSVLTHTVADHIDGLVALIFDSDDKELVFANLAGEIDVTQLGEIGKRLNVPGLDQVPGAR